MDVQDIVRQRYGSIARLVLEQQAGASCCGDTTCCTMPAGSDPITSDLYTDSDAEGIPESALLASLGCGNPTALAELHEGETVLDLGSGGGIDVLLSAKRVGPSGFAYGLDMTDEMIALAEENRRKSGMTNVRFLKGTIEDIPLPDASVDVIISNCVINLSGDKDRVLAEAFRVLKPGGRFSVSDIVWTRAIPPTIRRSVDLWAGCIAGALLESEYRDKLLSSGFVNVSVTPTRVYSAADIAGFASGSSSELEVAPADLEGAVISAFIRAEKPAQ